MGLLPSENAKQAKLAARLVVEALMSSALPFLPSASPPPAPLSSISEPHTLYHHIECHG